MIGKPTYKELEQRIFELENLKINSNPMEIQLRKKAEETLRRREETLSGIFDAMHSGVILVDNSGRIIFSNKRMAEMFGYSVENIVGREYATLAHDSESSKAKKQTILLIKGKTDLVSHERLYQHKDGSTFPGHISGRRLSHPDGSFWALVGVITDITEHKNIQEALKINEERYRELFEHMTNGVAVYTVKDDGKKFILKDFNQSAELISGAKRDIVIGKDAAKAFPGLEQAGVIKGLRQVYHTGETIHVPAVLYRDHQLKLWVEHNIYKLPSGEIVSVFNDISDKKRTKEKLQIERDKLQIVINGMGDNLYVVNNNFRIEFQNNLSREQFGDILGQTCYKEIFHLEEPCPFCLMHESLNKNCIKHVETDTLGHKSYELNFSPFQDRRKKIKIVVVMRDITEKKSLQAEAMQAGHLASLGELAAGVAHEINNPVTGIISIAEVLADKFEQLGGDRKIPERIIHEGERISRIVKNLLSFARVKKDDHSLISINEVLKKTLNLAEKQIFKDGIHLSLYILPGIPKIKAHDQEIQQVFFNIISNARYSLNEKYPETSKHKRLEITAKIIDIEQAAYVRITFLDSGNGITENILNVITDPFFSTKPRGEGTGLGLSISHGIINNHGGRLLFKTREGDYTKVIVDLPID